MASAVTTTCGDESCCASLLVPAGSFKRDFDGGEDYFDDSHAAEIRAFYLDKFEVTVGRMRQFVRVYEELKRDLADGDGKSSYVSDDAGWNTNSSLPATQDDLLTQLKCTGTTWSDAINENNDLPVNCLPFNVAYAFCVWDGGRLPTEAEWNYAAAGGDEQRVYPWKAPISGPIITSDYANYGDSQPGPIAVETTPLGNGRWGQADLAGNVAEWVMDYYSSTYPQDCVDCMNSTPALDRPLRGGSYLMDESVLVVAARGSLGANESRTFVGFRCARESR
jgi:formylglycine-generating enzyme required for sulfatase activity